MEREDRIKSDSEHMFGDSKPIMSFSLSLFYVLCVTGEIMLYKIIVSTERKVVCNVPGINVQ